uniref:UDP-glucose 6-dehydrogenase n=1 Tax=Caldisericum exile TaxID=693075 RepID=A0A7C4Y125_9BACT
MKRIAVVGSEGYVGNAVKRMLESHYQIVPYDIIGIGSKEEVNKSSLAVVCVPTPMKEDGSCDISIVEEVVSWIDTPVILIKSTIAPGTTDYLKKKYKKRIVFSPEYIGEGRYYVTPRMDFQTDMKKCPFLILGGDDKDCNYILDLLVPILGPEKIYYKVKPIEAELIKYMENTYFGVKITFAQEMYDICQKFGADWYRVWKGWALDPRVDVMHTAVFPENRGFTGKCLPKDLNALVKASEKAGYEPIMLKAMLKSNRKIRIRNGKKPDY